MADKRMFSRAIVESDAFYDLPLSAQALYLHLSLAADDEGFIGGPKKVARMVGASEDDLKALINARFLLAFDTGVCVIKHWYINNYIKSDRTKPTTFLDEKQALEMKENRAYTERKRFGNVLETNVSVDKNSIDIDKTSIDKIIIRQDKDSISNLVSKNNNKPSQADIDKNLARMRAQIREANKEEGRI